MANPNRDIIDIEGLTKRFKDFTAVDSVSLQIKEGEIFGLLGPNGAGKTTLISMLCTTLVPVAGTATVNGYDVMKQPDLVRKSIGIVFQDQSLDDRLTARENLMLHAMLYGVDKKFRKERINNVLELVELKDQADNLVRTYSGGMRRRLEIGRGLVHYPKVLFLDEPTIGLDPQTRKHVWDYIKELAKHENITILMTTHYMEEADMLCDRIAIIDHGKIIALGTPKELKAMVGDQTVILKISNFDCQEGKGKILRTFPKAKCFDGKVVIPVKNAQKEIKTILEVAKKARLDIEEANMHEPTLDDVFLHLTGREIRDEKAGSIEVMRMHAARHGFRGR